MQTEKVVAVSSKPGPTPQTSKLVGLKLFIKKSPQYTTYKHIVSKLRLKNLLINTSMLIWLNIPMVIDDSIPLERDPVGIGLNCKWNCKSWILSIKDCQFCQNIIVPYLPTLPGCQQWRKEKGELATSPYLARPESKQICWEHNSKFVNLTWCLTAREWWGSCNVCIFEECEDGFTYFRPHIC